MEEPLKSENKSLLPNRSKVSEGPDPNTDSKKRSSGGSTAEDKNTNPEAQAQAELATAIDQLLETVGSKFTSMSKDIMTQMDIMAARLDDLEVQAKLSIESEKKRDSGAS